MFDYLKNKLLYSYRYKTSSEAVIVSCFFNPQKSLYRIKAFHRFYESIKHLNHRIIECVIGNDTPQLPKNSYITKVYTDDLLWHKEALLNKVISELPDKFKYVFWVDADVIFTNDNWMVDAVEQFKNGVKILQPFEYCIHLEKNEKSPNFVLDNYRRETADVPQLRHKSLWRSFCANYVTTNYSDSKNYDKHGHVGFAWGATRDILDAMPLYDKALIGGGDHIISHAAAGHIPHNCITKSFADNIEEVEEWSRRFYNIVNGQIGYVTGDLYHIWHGDLKNREYLKRIQDFTKKTKEFNVKDKNGLYVGKDQYIKKYFDDREVVEFGDDFMNDIYFFQDLGYFLEDLIYMFEDYQENLDNYILEEDQFIEDNQNVDCPNDYLFLEEIDNSQEDNSQEDSENFS